MKKLFLGTFLVVTPLLVGVNLVSADTKIAGASSSLRAGYGTAIYSSAAVPEPRVQKLAMFFRAYNSPLEAYSEDFIAIADKYNIDWRLVPAITGVESTFGKRIPYKSYNAYGWANGEYKFNSWEQSIEVVSKTLREKYFDKGATSIDQVARRYAPPSSTWAGKVRYFINRIDAMPVSFTLEG